MTGTRLRYACSPFLLMLSLIIHSPPHHPSLTYTPCISPYHLQHIAHDRSIREVQITFNRINLGSSTDHLKNSRRSQVAFRITSTSTATNIHTTLPRRPTRPLYRSQRVRTFNELSRTHQRHKYNTFHLTHHSLSLLKGTGRHRFRHTIFQHLNHIDLDSGQSHH